MIRGVFCVETDLSATYSQAYFAAIKFIIKIFKDFSGDGFLSQLTVLKIVRLLCCRVPLVICVAEMSIEAKRS